MASPLSNTEKQQLEEISKKKYSEQGQYTLNAFWGELETKAEEIWGFWQKMCDLDKQQYNALVTAGKAEANTYKEGSSLDEFWSHKFLEVVGKTMSIVEFRKEFQKIDANVDKRMGLVEFILYHYKLSVHELLARPQGGNPEELAHAQKLLDEVSAAFKAAQEALDTASKTAEAARKAAAEAERSEAAAKVAAESAKKRDEAAAKTAEQAKKTAEEAAAAAAEQKAALDALKHEEETYNNKTKDLQSKSDGGGVAGMRAKNELAQHLSEDPLPLRKAKITAEAAAKKTEKANQIAATAAQKAHEDAKAAEAARIEAEQKEAQAIHDREVAVRDAAEAEAAKAEAEERLKESEAKLAETEAYLAEVKKKSDKTYGTFWWLDRELAERKKYMPKSGKAKLLF